MKNLKYTPCPVGPEVWMREGIRNYGEYCLLYLDGALAIQEYGLNAIEEIGKCFEIKKGSI